MRISSIQNNYNCKTSCKPVFKAYSTTVYDALTHRFKYDTTTCFARRDLDWNKFFEFLFQKYKNVDKVNVISHACSVGEEAYTLAMGFLAKTPDFKKFLPVIARDIDNKNLKIAREGIYDVGNLNELGRIQSVIGQNYENYFQKLFNTNSENCDIQANLFNKTIFKDTEYIRLKAKDYLKNNVIFQQADVLHDLENIPQENTVLLLRNVWPYLGLNDMGILADKLANHLKPSSTLVIGLYDACWKLENKLLKAGFKKTPVQFVYEK